MSPFRLRVCCLSVLAFLSSSLPSHAADKWLSVRSKNFVLVGNASEGSIRRVGRELEEFRTALSNLFPNLNKPSPIGTTVVVFKDEASFKPYKPLYEGKAGNVAGYFQPGEDMNFIALSSDTHSPKIVYHEFVHSLTKDTSSPLPPWASEGFAELYSMFESSGKEILLGRAIGEHLALLNQQPMLPLPLLFSVSHGSPYYNEKTKQGMFYAQSWAVVHYLMFAENGKRRQQLVKYLSLTLSGGSIDANFREAFGIEYGTLEEELRRYVQNQMAWPAIKLKLPEKLDFDREMQVAALSDAQAQYYLGDLLLHMNRLDAAETQLQKAAALDPMFAATYASLGLLKIRQGHNDESLVFLAKAVEGDSQNHLAHYYYAFMLQKAGDRDAAEDEKSRLQLMRTHIEKSIELAPQFIGSYSMLGYLAFRSRDRLAEAESQIRKGIEYAPGRLELRLTLAQLMVLNREIEPAQALLRSLQANAGDETIRFEAGRWLDDIKNQQDYERELKAFEQRRREREEAAERVTIDDRIDDRVADEPPKITRPNETPAPREDLVIETAKPQVAPPNGIRIEGTLTQVECRDGLTLRVRVGNGFVELHTNTPEKLEFLSYVSTVSDTIACGPTKPEVNVVLYFRRGSDPRFLGEPLRVEFVNPK